MVNGRNNLFQYRALVLIVNGVLDRPKTFLEGF